MVLPFEPLNIVFQDVKYYVETPMVNLETNQIGVSLSLDINSY